MLVLTLPKVDVYLDDISTIDGSSRERSAHASARWTHLRRKERTHVRFARSSRWNNDEVPVPPSDDECGYLRERTESNGLSLPTGSFLKSGCVIYPTDASAT